MFPLASFISPSVLCGSAHCQRYANELICQIIVTKMEGNSQETSEVYKIRRYIPSFLPQEPLNISDTPSLSSLNLLLVIAIKNSRGMLGTCGTELLNLNMKFTEA